MKTKFNFRNVTQNLLIAVFALFVSSELVAQEKRSTELKDFKIIIKKTNEGIEMLSIEGSAWKTLSYNVNNEVPQAIDEYGMTELNKVSSLKDSNLADFLFTLTKTESGITLKGIEGTVWTDLSFSLPEHGKQAIDQFGMINQN